MPFDSLSRRVAHEDQGSLSPRDPRVRRLTGLFGLYGLNLHGRCGGHRWQATE